MVLPLPRSAARLAAVLDALPDGVVLVQRDGTVAHANASALGMFGAPDTGLVGRRLPDLLPTLDPRLDPGRARRGPEGEPAPTVPLRTTARRTDGGMFPVEVTGAALEDGHERYAEGSGHSGDGTRVLVVRDLTGTLDTEAELARSRRQTEMILRAASEGVVGTDLEGRVVLANPAFAEILGYRTEDLDGTELHPLILARRADGTPFPYEDSPLADTLKSGRKHRVRSQVLWSKDGDRVPVDLTTAPVRDGDRLVGAVMTFTDRRPYEELVARHTAEREEQAERYAALASRYTELAAVLAEAGPPDGLLPHPAGARPEVDARSRTSEPSATTFTRHPTTLGTLVTVGIDKAATLTGPHRTQFAVHAPPVVVTLDPARASTALAHLIADASGVTSAGAAHTPAHAASRADTTVIITAALRSDHLRIEISGPRAVNDPAHVLVARRIIDAHGGYLTSREHPRGPGLTYVIQIPHAPTPPPAPAAPYRTPARPAEAERAPVAGSWIIGAAVGAHRDRTAARSRPYALPAEPAPRLRSGADGADEVEEQRIVRLLDRIRRQSA
ncbi:PAS domain S-box protein [Streptomyces sp. NPDC039028]|uniref:PAS domain S-box protein n=1 Tax=Streptomyces sp. NPDC039028 TaxID=3155370 RepID=UPI0033FD21D1